MFPGQDRSKRDAWPDRNTLAGARYYFFSSPRSPHILSLLTKPLSSTMSVSSGTSGGLHPGNHALARMAVLASGNALMITVSLCIIPAVPAIARHYDSALLAQFILMSPVPLKIVGAPMAALLMRRFGRRRSLLGCLSLLAVPGAVAIAIDAFWVQLVLRLTMGFAGAAISAIVTTLAGDYFSGTQRDRALAWLGGAPQVGAVLGLFGGGLLAQTFGWQWAYALLLLAAPAFVAAWLLLPEPSTTLSAAESKSTVAAAALPPRFAVFLFICAVATMISVFGTYQLPFLLAEDGIEDASFAGTLLALSAVTGGIGAALYPALRRHLGLYGVFAWLTGICGLAYFLLAFANGKGWFLVLAPLIGMGGGVLFSFCGGGAIEKASAAARPRAAGLTMGAIFTGQLSLPFLTEPIRAVYGAPALFVFASVLAWTAGVVVWSVERASRLKRGLVSVR